MSRTAMRVAAVLALLTICLAPIGHAPRLAATPVATDDVTYTVMGRVFPDPHGCRRGLPLSSPWAKGNVCAVQFIQWDEFVSGLEYLEQKFPRYVELVDLHEEMGLQSAGLPTATLDRDKRNLYAVRVTDKESPVPEAERKRFVYSLSIHGIERAGIEGGLRAAEDLATWAATEPDKRILEPTNDGPTAREVVENSVAIFLISNPDGWHRGDITEGGVFYQRYNGNGMDLNRDFPSVGYTELAYTPASEPESQGYMAYLERERQATASGRFAGAIDLHGMTNAHAFSFSLLAGGRKDFRKNAISVDTSIRTFRDSEARLTWSPLVAPSDSCPGDLLVVDGPLCTDEWGTVWDTIDYLTTGSFAEWVESPIGLDAAGVDNEMFLSHLAPNNVFVPELEQLHIDGNKGLIYSNIASLLFEQPVTFQPGGRVAYVPNPSRVTSDAARAASLPDLPVQEPIEGTEVFGQGFEFDVQGVNDGVSNGSLTVEATLTNVAGIGGGAIEDMGEEFALVLERQGGVHPGDSPDEWVEVARYFNQSGGYAQAGMRMDLAAPLPGRYRIRPATRIGVTRFAVTFGGPDSNPVPAQAAYDVANTDFFADLNRFVPEGSKLRSFTKDDILKRDALGGVDTLVLADDPAPGVPEGDRSAWFERLRAFVDRGGNLVLTDSALTALEAMGVVPSGSVRRGFFYAGWADFNDGESATYEKHPLAAHVNKPGAAEGAATLDDVDYVNRHQTYEPVPIGYYVSPRGASNSDCDASDDRCDAPNWIVEADAWKQAGGTVAGRTFARTEEAAGSDGVAGVSIGELTIGGGRVRVIGALLPQPTQKNPHPFGLASYGVTYTGYEVIANAMGWPEPAGAPVAGGGAVAGGGSGSLPATGPLNSTATIKLLGGALLALAIVLSRPSRRPRRLSARSASRR